MTRKRICSWQIAILSVPVQSVKPKSNMEIIAKPVVRLIAQLNLSIHDPVFQAQHPSKKSRSISSSICPSSETCLRPGHAGGTLQEQVANKLSEWLDEDLQQWDISRDAPYFGFEIPGAPGKYFYVWVDAPIGYMASFENFCQREGYDFDSYWSADSDAEVYHFIGKDIINFPYPVLARGTDQRRLPHAQRSVCPWFSYRGRHQDVQIQGHLHQCTHLP